MMDNIQAIIADRQYQGALEIQNATIRPYKEFPLPKPEELIEFLDRIDLSLRALLDSPIGCFELKYFAKRTKRMPILVDFLVQFERIKVLEAPDLNSAKILMEIALQFQKDYPDEVTRLSKEFREYFGPITFVGKSASDNDFLGQRVQSLEDSEDDDKVESDNYDSKGNENFPDSTLPVKQSEEEYKKNKFYSPFGSSVFGGYLQEPKDITHIESSVDTEILSPTLGIKKPHKKQVKSTKEVKNEVNDRNIETRQLEFEEKVNRKEKAIEIFTELSNAIKEKADTLVKDFENTKEYKEMLNLMWYAEQTVSADDFLMFRDLGRGAFGVVSAAKTKTTGTLTAIKCMNKKLIKGKKAKRLVVAEKAILEVLGDNPSSFTIWLRYSFQDRDYFYMAIPLCTGGDLSYHLKKKNAFPLERAKFTFAEILEGIDHLHNLSIVYRDLKPENVIFDAEGHARISDMGLAIQTGGRRIRGKAGTPGYWAPEVITNQPYSFSADHWSLGCVFYEMLVGRCPFSASNTRLADRNEGTLKWAIKFPQKYGRGEEAILFPVAAKTVILGLLDRNKAKRFGASDLRNAKYFEKFDWFKLQTRQLDPPWRPRAGKINAPDQIELDFGSKDKNYKNIKITEEDEIENFTYTSKYSHQLDIVQVLETRSKNKLNYDTHYESNCCDCTCM